MKLSSIFLQAGGNTLFLIIVVVLIIILIILGLVNRKKTSKFSANLIRDNRYPALNLISNIFMVLAIIVAALALLITAYFLRDGRSELFAVISFFAGTIGTIGFLAISESIIVLIDIEQNTRVVQKK